MRVPRGLRIALQPGARTGTGRTLSLAVGLTVIVILAAGIGGTSEFTGARWFPHFRESPVRPRTGTIVVPTTTLIGGTARRVRQHGVTLPIWLEVTVLAIVALALIAFLWRWWRGRRLPGVSEPAASTIAAATHQAVEAEPEPEPEMLLSGIELALEVLDEEREPADAVVRAWLGLQETAGESGIVRRASETPTEFTSRILSHAFADDRAVNTLLRLYLRTRFGDHPVTTEDVADVRVALAQLVSSWKRAGTAATTRAR